jgi:hypothetical protein
MDTVVLIGRKKARQLCGVDSYRRELHRGLPGATRKREETSQNAACWVAAPMTAGLEKQYEVWTVLRRGLDVSVSRLERGPCLGATLEGQSLC